LWTSWSRLGASLLLLGSLSACQPLDTEAASGGIPPDDEEGSGAGLDPELIELSEVQGGDACEVVDRQAHAILERSCARCHGGASPGARQGAPPFDAVLDTERLVTLTSATVTDPTTHEPARFLVPGDPDRSRIYLRPLNGEMPPPDIIGLPPNPRPSVSDLSVLRQWIESCVQAPDSPAGDPDRD
jgi:hypothetical protein